MLCAIHFYKERQSDNTWSIGLYAEEHGGRRGERDTQKINTVLVNAQDVTTAAVIFP